MNSKELKLLLSALTEQGWTYEQAASGHYKMRSPDRTQPLVCSALGSNDLNIMKIVIRDLKRSGFIWPWSPKAVTRKVEEPKKGKTTMHVVPPVKEAEPPQSSDAAHPDMDLLFRQLKEARNYAQLAREARDEARAAAAKAEESLRGSEKELEIAVAQLKNAKQAFDETFGAVE